MIAPDLRLGDDLDRLYAGDQPDPTFRRILDHLGGADDDEALAQLIEADGRLRMRLQRPVGLERYADAVPDLTQRPDALDAAIDMSLRELAQTGRADQGSIDALVARHPDLEPAIRDAAALNNALWSTERVQAHLGRPSRRNLPCDFGPVMEGGGKRYRLHDLLGAGAFGQVYLAVDGQLSDEAHPAYVAIKILPATRGPTLMRHRLTDEATKARRIDHPNVARVLDRGISDDDEDFIVYEFVEGGDLGRWARRRAGTLAASQAVPLVAKIARGVHAAHMAGLVHCDLKPNNIVVTADGEPKVADFGIAVRTEDEHAGRVMPSARERPEGNLAFMSPEQFRMEPGALTIPTDVYALGGTLYWLMTGALPNGSTPEAIRRTHDAATGRRDAPSLRPVCRDADRDLDAICRRAMAIEPEARYPSAAALADDLEAWLRREPIAWTRPSSLRRLGLWTRRKPALAGASLLLLLTVAGSAFALERFASAARDRRLEAYRATVRLEEEERARRGAHVKLQAFVGGLRAAQAQGLRGQVLTTVWLTEWLYGPTVLGEGPGRFDLWDRRVSVIRELVQARRGEGGGDHFETLLWESALGFWLIRDGEYGEAEPLLAEVGARWASRLAADDPWLLHVGAMHACAVVGRAKATAANGNGPDLAALAARLERAERSLENGAHGSPLHVLVLTHLGLLYGADLLDDPVRRRELEDRLEAIEAEAD